MFNFGAGRARITSASTGQALELGVVQSASVELKVDMKELRGPYRYPLAVADGKGSCTGKINFMHLWPETLAALLANGAAPTNAAPNTPVAVNGETGVIDGSNHYAVLASGAAGTTGTWIPNSEVITVTTAGTPYYYTRVAGGSEASAGVAGNASGAYSSNTTVGSANYGRFTFAAADTGKTVMVSYLYAPANVNNYGVQLSQIGMNSAMTFQAVLIGVGKNIYTNAAQQFIIQLNACLAPSMKFNMKLDDFTDLELDFSAFIDATGNLGAFYLVNP